MLVSRQRVSRVNELRRWRHTDRRIKTMNAVNSVQLFLLVWTFTAVCRADDDFCRVSCEDVSGTVGEEVTFTCSIRQLRSECCITMYKFLYPKSYKKSEICRQDLPEGSCEQRNSFTCNYTPATTAMTGRFRFFLQTTCGKKNPEFSVNITEARNPETVTEALPKEERLESNTKASSGSEAGPRSNGTVVPAIMGCFIILILIITMTIIYKSKSNYIKPCGFQKRMFWGHRHDDNDNSNCPENAINITDSTV